MSWIGQGLEGMRPEKQPEDQKRVGRRIATAYDWTKNRLWKPDDPDGKKKVEEAPPTDPNEYLGTNEPLPDLEPAEEAPKKVAVEEPPAQEEGVVEESTLTEPTQLSQSYEPDAPTAAAPTLPAEDKLIDVETANDDGAYMIHGNAKNSFMSQATGAAVDAGEPLLHGGQYKVKGKMQMPESVAIKEYVSGNLPLSALPADTADKAWNAKHAQSGVQDSRQPETKSIEKLAEAVDSGNIDFEKLSMQKQSALIDAEMAKMNAETPAAAPGFDSLSNEEKARMIEEAIKNEGIYKIRPGMELNVADNP